MYDEHNHTTLRIQQKHPLTLTNIQLIILTFIYQMTRMYPKKRKYNGEPIFVSEYGGIKCDIENSNSDSWGYRYELID